MSTRLRFATWAALAGSLAVLLAGLVAVVVVERSLYQVVDERIAAEVLAIGRDSDVDASCRRARARSEDPRGRVASIVVAGVERCRSNLAAPSPRSLGIDPRSVEDGDPLRSGTRRVDGVSWRIGVLARDEMLVIVGEQFEAADRARRNAQQAILVAIAVGILLAVVAGAIASAPATRRIDRLLARIGRAVDRRGVGEPIAGGLGRDLDAAGRSIDELLARLGAAEAARHRLFADAAHQLRTPVTSIRTNAQLLERRDDLAGEARDIARRIATQSAAIGELVSSLVDYAAVEAWSVEEVRPLGDLARDAAERAAARWPDLKVSIESDASTARVDAELVVRAIGNLIDNAIVHGEPPVTITVRDGVIEVSDAGDGFVDGERAFEPFSSRGDGSGLGLAFVAHVAQAHGGTARIGDGPGTSVILDLRDRTTTLG